MSRLYYNQSPVLGYSATSPYGTPPPPPQFVNQQPDYDFINPNQSILRHPQQYANILQAAAAAQLNQQNQTPKPLYPQQNPQYSNVNQFLNQYQSQQSPNGSQIETNPFQYANPRPISTQFQYYPEPSYPEQYKFSQNQYPIQNSFPNQQQYTNALSYMQTAQYQNSMQNYTNSLAQQQLIPMAQFQKALQAKFTNQFIPYNQQFQPSKPFAAHQMQQPNQAFNKPSNFNNTNNYNNNYNNSKKEQKENKSPDIIKNFEITKNSEYKSSDTPKHHKDPEKPRASSALVIDQDKNKVKKAKVRNVPSKFEAPKPHELNEIKKILETFNKDNVISKILQRIDNDRSMNLNSNNNNNNNSSNSNLYKSNNGSNRSLDSVVCSLRKKKENNSHSNLDSKNEKTSHKLEKTAINTNVKNMKIAEVNEKPSKNSLSDSETKPKSRSTSLKRSEVKTSKNVSKISEERSTSANKNATTEVRASSKNSNNSESRSNSANKNLEPVEPSKLVIKQKFKFLGIFNANPDEYVKQYGDELIPAIFNEKKNSSESIKV